MFIGVNQACMEVAVQIGAIDKNTPVNAYLKI